MNAGQQVQTAAKRLASRLMRGTIPQSDSTIEVTVIVTIHNDGCKMDFSASEVLENDDGSADGRDMSILVSE
jgi:hypothetical protein